jgi:hypothetical protein
VATLIVAGDGCLADTAMMIRWHPLVTAAPSRKPQWAGWVGCGSPGTSPNMVLVMAHRS